MHFPPARDDVYVQGRIFVRTPGQTKSFGTREVRIREPGDAEDVVVNQPPRLISVAVKASTDNIILAHSHSFSSLVEETMGHNGHKTLNGIDPAERGRIDRFGYESFGSNSAEPGVKIHKSL
jgi:hypothetical protein